MVAALACAVLLAAVLLVPPRQETTAAKDLVVHVKVFPHLGPYPTDSIRFRLDSAQVREPAERGDGWIRIEQVEPGSHSLAIVDGQRLIALKQDFQVVAGKTNEISVLQVPPEALDVQAKPKGRVLERGTWKPVAGARVAIREPDLVATTDQDGYFELDRPVELRRIFQAGVDAVGYRYRSLSVERLSVEAVEHFNKTGEVLIPIARVAAGPPAAKTN